MRRLFTAFVLLALGVASLRGGGPDGEKVRRARTLTMEGLRSLYNFDVDDANRKFDDAIGIEPQYPRPYYSRALAPAWKSFVTRSDADYEEATRLLTEAIEVGRQYLDAVDERDADALACLGLAYGYRTYIHFVRKSYLKAVWDAKQSYDYLVEAVSVDPQFYDAYLGLGLYHFSVATIPKPLQWLVGILGVEGDRDRGVREIELAAKRGSFSVAEAKFFLIQFYPWYKGDFDAGEKLADDLIRTYPGNTVFLYAKGFLKLRQNNLAGAIPYFLKMRGAENAYFASINKFAEYRLGECYFRLGEYPEARKAFQAFLALNGRGMFEAVAGYHAGLAAELTGDRASALPLYQRAKNFDGSHGDDMYAARHAAKLLTAPLSLADSMLIVARNYHRRALYERAVETYNDLLAGYSLSNDERAEAVFRMGDCLYDAGRYDEASEQFRAVLKLRVNLEQWVMPWAHFMLGQIALKKNDPTTAQMEFELVEEYDGYDHKNWLSYRAERHLERLKDMTSETK